MEKYTGCNYHELEDGGFLVCDVSLPSGPLSQVFLAPGGVCAVTNTQNALKQVYEDLRNTLGTPGILLYLDSEGYYDPYENAVQPIPGGSEQQEREISQMLSVNAQVHKRERLVRMRDKLVEADAYHRGYYTDSEGTLYLLHHGRFQCASRHDPEFLFNLTAFGGFLGLHRFAMGKFLSGLFYLGTCGVFLTGWLVDILQLFLGAQKDKYKFLVPPLQDKRSKLLRLLPALAVGIAAFMLYTQLFSLFISAGETKQSGIAQAIANTLLRMFPQLSEMPEN